MKTMKRFSVNMDENSLEIFHAILSKKVFSLSNRLDGFMDKCEYNAGLKEVFYPRWVRQAVKLSADTFTSCLEASFDLQLSVADSMRRPLYELDDYKE